MPSAITFGHVHYVVGIDPEQLMPRVREQLDKPAFNDIEVKAQFDQMYATRLDLDYPWVRWVVGRLSSSNGGEIAVVSNFGGLLPNDVFANELGLPAIWAPLSYAGVVQHAPNKHNAEDTTQTVQRPMAGL